MKNIKLIAARKEKNMTQSVISRLLAMSQSQYQRRESGEIVISDNEWDRMAKLLGKEVEDIKEEKIIITESNNETYFGNDPLNDTAYCSIPRFMLKNQQNFIEMLKEENKKLKDRVNCEKTAGLGS